MSELLSLPPLAWLANYLLHSTLLLGLVWFCDAAGLLRTPRNREFAWRLVVFGALLTASVHTFVPEVSLSGKPRLPELAVAGLRVVSSDPTLSSATTGTFDTRSTHEPPAPISPPVERIAGRHPGVSVPFLLLGLWLAGALMNVVRVAWTAKRALRELSGRERCRHGALHSRLARLCGGADIKAPCLSIVDDLPGPVTLPNGEICLPRWAVARLDPRQLDAMLAHEIAHVRRRDPWLLLAVTLLEAMLFVQPLNRLAHRRLAGLAELNADAFAAQLTGDSRALAEALTECVQHIQQHPSAYRRSLLGVPMATRHSPVIQRVEQLLGGKDMHQKVSRAMRALGVASLVGAVLLLPAFGTRDANAGLGVFIGTSVTEDDAGNMEFEIARPGYFLHVKTRGEVTFNTAEDDIADLAPGASIRIREKRDGTLRELVVENKSGAVTRDYAVNRTSSHFDADARAWLARVIPEVLRSTGIDAERRVARIHAEGGVKAVLEEMKRIENGHALSRYAGTLVQQYSLDNAELQSLLQMLRDVGSDFELRQALSNIVTNHSLNEQNQLQLLKAAAGIGSDFEAAELMQLVTPELTFSEEALKAWREVINEIGSDFEQRRALSPLFEHSRLPKSWKVAALDAATRNIGSDFELRSLLGSVAEEMEDDSDLASAYIEALQEIGSDFEAREAVVALVNNTRLGVQQYSDLLDAIDEIGSDFEALQALLAVATHMPREKLLVEKYRRLAEELASHEQAQAERAIQ